MALSFYDTYGATAGNKLDIRDLITVVSPEDTPVYSVLPDGEANGTEHIWLTIPLPTAADNKHVEGTAYSFASGDTETRKSNFTQIFIKSWKISGTQEAVGKYGRSSDWDYRRMLSMKAFKIDMEYELLDNTASAAGATTATEREFKGLGGAALDGGVTANAHAVSGSLSPISEDVLNSPMETMWTAGARPNKVACSGFVKRSIAGFLGNGAGRPLNSSNGDRSVLSVVDSYESDFGRVDIMASRAINPKSAVYVWDNELVAKAWLRPPFQETPPKDGDYFPGVILSEFTFEYLNPNGCGRIMRVASA